MNEVLGKLPPQNLELEQVILGALMIDSSAIELIYDSLKVEDFYHPNHRQVYLAITNLFKQNKPIDLLTVSAELKEMGFLESVGGRLWIAKLTENVVSGANIEVHSLIIRELALKRHLIALGQTLTVEGYKDTTDALELLKTAENGIFEISIKKHGKTEKKIGDLYFDLVKGFETKKQGESDGYKTGFKALDQIANGVEQSNLIILAARPGMGKSAFALNLAMNLCETLPIAFFSLEMSNKELTTRFASSLAEIPLQFIKTNSVFGTMFDKAANNIPKAQKSMIYLDDSPALTLTEIRTRIRRMIMNYGIQIVIIDYLQKVKPEFLKGRTRENEINEIASGLKNIAKEFQVPVIALSQLSRSLESRADKRPMLSDLRESGAIEQEADQVWFIYREEYYSGNDKGKAEIIVAKNRQGQCGTAEIEFNGDFTKFEDKKDFYQFGTDVELKDIF